MLVDLMSKEFYIMDYDENETERLPKQTLLDFFKSAVDPEWITNIKSYNMAVKNCLQINLEEKYISDHDLKLKCSRKNF